MRLAERAGDILEFWFGENASYDTAVAINHRIKTLWFAEGEKVDNEIRMRFKRDLESVTCGMLAELTTLREKLAAVVLLDQFSRNMFRESERAFAWDSLALKLAKGMVSSGEDQDLEPIERVFVYLPFEHSEKQEDQELSVQKFEALYTEVGRELQDTYQVFLEYAIRHKDIIERFGRFPHRNSMLGRESTREETDFLNEPNSSF